LLSLLFILKEEETMEEKEMVGVAETVSAFKISPR
jgi:hypothetical protein